MEIVKASEFGLEEEKGKSIELSFSPKVSEKEALTDIYNSLIKEELSPELCVKANDLRKKLVKVRTGISKIHKAEKAVSLAYGRFVDAHDNLEKERIDKLDKERYALLMVYLDEEVIPLHLGEMDTEIFNNYFNGVKLAHKTKLEAEAKAESERLALIEKERLEKIEAEKERKRIEAENLRLKKEAEERERKILEEKLAEQKKAESERIAREKIEKEKEAKRLAELKAIEEKAEQERLERERLAEIERKKQAEILESQRREAAEKARIEAEKQAKIKAELEEKARKEREEKERIEAELKEKAEAERLEAERIAREKEAELQKGDAEKFETLISDLTKLKIKYSFESELNKKKMKDTSILIDKIIKHIS
jgi:hypothetical protein